jgi:hypothetical protein
MVRIRDSQAPSDEGNAFAALRRNARQREKQAGDDDDDRRNDRKPADERDRPRRHALVELVRRRSRQVIVFMSVASSRHSAGYVYPVSKIRDRDKEGGRTF